MPQECLSPGLVTFFALDSAIIIDVKKINTAFLGDECNRLGNIERNYTSPQTLIALVLPGPKKKGLFSVYM